MTDVKDLWDMINDEGKSTEDIIHYVMSEDNLSYRDATAKIKQRTRRLYLNMHKYYLV